jgi:hypothetical protein
MSRMPVRCERMTSIFRSSVTESWHDFDAAPFPDVAMLYRRSAAEINQQQPLPPAAGIGFCPADSFMTECGQRIDSCGAPGR